MLRMEFWTTDRDGVWIGLTVTFFVSEIDLVYKWFKMNNLRRNPILNVIPLPVDIILSPSWWHKHEGINFDRDFFFHPVRRVEVERKMEQALYDRWGRYGLGIDRNKNLPLIGAVHLAAGFLLSEMLGCGKSGQCAAMLNCRL